MVENPPRERPRPCLAVPFCAGGAAVRPDDGAVDHLDRLADALDVVQHLEQEIPQTSQGPSAEMAIDRRPLTEEIRQVAPLGTGSGNPEDTVEDEPMIPRSATAVGASCRHEGLEKRHSSSLIRSRINVAALRKRLRIMPRVQGESYSSTGPSRRAERSILSADLKIRSVVGI